MKVDERKPVSDPGSDSRFEPLMKASLSLEEKVETQVQEILISNPVAYGVDGILLGGLRFIRVAQIRTGHEYHNVSLSCFQTRPGHRNARNKDPNFNQRSKSWCNPSPILDLANPAVPLSVHPRSPPPRFSEMEITCGVDDEKTRFIG
ncbi:hypothetical protein Droror1_Dr00006401 [Drosera rotundifolia]